MCAWMNVEDHNRTETLNICEALQIKTISSFQVNARHDLIHLSHPYMFSNSEMDKTMPHKLNKTRNSYFRVHRTHNLTKAIVILGLKS